MNNFPNSEFNRGESSTCASRAVFVRLSASAWAVMMDRRQQRLLLVLLPPALFVPSPQDEAGYRKSLEALGEDTQPFIIYEETSDIWINVRGKAGAA